MSAPPLRSKPAIGCFVSPHGYGHATRVTAVLEALLHHNPELRLHLFTTVPEQIFRQSLPDFTYHNTIVDVGLAQASALQTNIPETIDRLATLLPYSEKRLHDLAQQCAGYQFILADIAPLGIAVAQRAGIPSVLVENFTWDWIYEPYCQDFPQMARFSAYFERLFAAADIHIQTEPLCRPGPCDLHCGPIFRKTRGERDSLRYFLKPGERPIVLITMGGVAEQVDLLGLLSARPDMFFVLSGCSKTCRPLPNVLELGRETSIYHPDLIAAADLVVCKAGYSTIAECSQAGSRVISVGRDDFAETVPLERFLQQKLSAVCIGPAAFHAGEWFHLADQLLNEPCPAAATENGAEIIASFLARKLL